MYRIPVDGARSYELPRPCAKSKNRTGEFADHETRLTASSHQRSPTASRRLRDGVDGRHHQLRNGRLFRVRTCVAYHLKETPPASRCAERSVDTCANTDSVFTHAPRVTLSRRGRPITEPWGYFITYTEVKYLSGSEWLVATHSWPGGGLRTAGIATHAAGSAPARTAARASCSASA